MRLLLVACQSPVKIESSFLRSFNLRAAVEQMRVAELRPTSGGGNSFETSGRSRRHISFEYLLDARPGAPSDEAAFLTKLAIEIVQQVSKPGARTDQSGSSGDGFYFNYSTDESRSSIDVINTKVEANRYRLVCIVCEDAGIKSNSVGQFDRDICYGQN